MPERKRFPCICLEGGKDTCDFASWPIGLKPIRGAGHLFIFQKDEDGLHEIMVIRNEWLPILKEAIDAT